MVYGKCTGNVNSTFPVLFLDRSCTQYMLYDGAHSYCAGNVTFPVAFLHRFCTQYMPYDQSHFLYAGNVTIPVLFLNRSCTQHALGKKMKFTKINSTGNVPEISEQHFMYILLTFQGYRNVDYLVYFNMYRIYQISGNEQYKIYRNCSNWSTSLIIAPLKANHIFWCSKRCACLASNLFLEALSN